MTFIAGLETFTPTYVLIMCVLSVWIIPAAPAERMPSCLVSLAKESLSAALNKHRSIHSLLHTLSVLPWYMLPYKKIKVLAAHIAHSSICSSHAGRLPGVLPQLQWNCQVTTSTTHAHPSYIALISKTAVCSFVLPGGVLHLRIHVRCIYRIVVRNGGCCTGRCVVFLKTTGIKWPMLHKNNHTCMGADVSAQMHAQLHRESFTCLHTLKGRGHKPPDTPTLLLPLPPSLCRKPQHADTALQRCIIHRL